MSDRFFTTGHETTFHSMYSLQHLASSISMSTQREPAMTWKEGSDHTCLIYRGIPITVSHIQDIVGHLEDVSVKLLREILLFNHPFHIPIDKLRDELGNNEPGYSIFTNAYNRQFLGPKDQLLTHILNTRHLRQKYVLSIRNGVPVWNKYALNEYLQHQSQLDLLCLTQIEMNCGAPARTTELTALPVHNTLYGMPRGLRIIDDNVCLMRVYHKMRVGQGHDRLIPHALNASLAAILIYKEVLVRPFAQFAAFQLYSPKPNTCHIPSPKLDAVHVLYATYLFVNGQRAFTSKDISELLASVTELFIGGDLKLTISLWRQLSTAFRRIFAGLQEAFLLEDMNTADAEQAGHSHAIDHLHYGVTERSAFGVAEDYIGPFFRVSHKWQRFLKLVPGSSPTFSYASTLVWLTTDCRWKTPSA